MRSITKKNSKDRAGIEQIKWSLHQRSVCFLLSWCARWAALARTRPKTMFGHLKAVARKIETECFCRNLPISNDPVVRISRNFAKKIVQKPREWSITKNLKFDRGNFLIIQNMSGMKTIYGHPNLWVLIPFKARIFFSSLFSRSVISFVRIFHHICD